MPRQSAQREPRFRVGCRDRQPPAVARLSLTPQKREFFDLYNQAATNIVAIADRLVALLDRFPDGADELGREVKELEHEGDRLTHELVDLLNRTRSEEHTSELQSR